MITGVNSPDQVILAGTKVEDYRAMDLDRDARISEICSSYQ